MIIAVFIAMAEKPLSRLIGGKFLCAPQVTLFGPCQLPIGSVIAYSQIRFVAEPSKFVALGILGNRSNPFTLFKSKSSAVSQMSHKAESHLHFSSARFTAHQILNEMREIKKSIAFQ